MNECESFQELISARVDGELAPESDSRLVEHVSACRTCRAEYELMLQMKTSVGAAMAAVTCPDSLRRSIEAALDPSDTERREQHQIRRRPAPWWQFAWAPAAAAAGLVLLFIGRPAYVPIHQLPALENNRAATAVATASPRDAAARLGSETGLPIRPVELSALGMRFDSAGKADVGGCRAGYFTFVTPEGSRITVFEICPNKRTLPEGAGLERYTSAEGARLVKAADGCNIVFWPQNGMVIAICSEMPVESIAGASSLVSSQLQGN